MRTVQTVLLPWVYDKASLLNTFIGLIVLGLATARAAVFPRSAGYLMAAAFRQPGRR